MLKLTTLILPITIIKTKNALSLAGLVVLMVLTSFAHAEQLAYSKRKQTTGLHYSYQWQDSFKQTQNLEFTMPIKQQGQYSHKRFVNNLAQQYVYIELLKAARQIDPREARINIRRRTQNNIEIEVSSRSDQMLTKWRNAMNESQDDAFDNYLSDNYYSRFISYLGKEAIKPDHLRYINENKVPLLPVAQAIYDTLPLNTESRIYVNLLLSWVQSIPYNELEDRTTSNGAGYLPPLGVITNNQGDCDSKSVLMASLIRSLLPDVPMVMIYLPEHALLGISMPHRSDEPTYTFEGIDYLLMEPTGPAVMPIGTIGDKSKSDITSGLYSYEHIR